MKYDFAVVIRVFSSYIVSSSKNRLTFIDGEDYIIYRTARKVHDIFGMELVIVYIDNHTFT